ncbi:transglycosylase SLT domain-containing protein, partial [bacterium]
LVKIKILFIILYVFSISYVFCQKEESRQNAQVKISEAETMKNLGDVLYKTGEIEAAVKVYKKSIESIENVISDAAISSQITENFEKIFKELKYIMDNIGIEEEDARNLEEYIIKISSENVRVQTYIKQYSTKRKRPFSNALSRYFKYKNMIEELLQQEGLPRELIYLPIVESMYTTKARSRAGAVGLWQLMPPIARHHGLKVNYWIDERKDPEKSTQAAIKYLKYVYELFDDWHLALSAYNRGHYGIKRDLKYSKAVNFFTLDKRRAIPTETAHFVPKFIAFTILADNYDKYGFKPEIEEYVFDTVILDKPLDLKIAAKCIGTTVEKLRELNPSILVWCTPPNYKDFKFRIPDGTKEVFWKNLTEIKDWNPSRGLVRHKVRWGDCLSKIASKYHTKVSRIKKDNKIKNSNKLRTGRVLNIRPGKKYYLRKKR